MRVRSRITNNGSRTTFRVSLLLAGLCICALADPGNDVLLIYNSRLPESKDVAFHYAERRSVPTNQIFGLPLSAEDEISRTEFRESLQNPLAKILESNKFWRIGPQTVPAAADRAEHVERKVVESKIRYLVLCYGVPLKIGPDSTLKEDGSDKLRVELRRNEAAVDNELCLLPLIEEKPPLSGPLRNVLYTTTNTAFLHPTNSLLLVTRLDGPSPAIARALADKAIEAETDGLCGRAYFDLRNTTDPAFKQGDDWIRGASEICRHLGLETIVDENPGTFPAGFPMSQIGIYIGWYTENVNGPFALPTVEFMPGAFAYHLHSFSAASLRTTNHNWAGPLLAKGATITMGCVNEPFLGGTPDMGIFTARLVFNGFSFGEAAYACQPVLSWQTTVVGDPLYRPFGKNPELFHKELLARHARSVEWSNLRWINLNLANGRPMADMVAFLEQLKNTKESAVLTEKLGDLYAAQGKPSSATHAYAAALKLDPTPQQHIRLLLTLGEKLTTLDQTREALDYYEQLVQNFPNYPDKLMVYKKLLPLAQKLDQKDTVAKAEAEINQHSPRQ